jgi:hypothetical protein
MHHTRLDPNSSVMLFPSPSPVPLLISQRLAIAAAAAGSPYICRLPGKCTQLQTTALHLRCFLYHSTTTTKGNPFCPSPTGGNYSISCSNPGREDYIGC